MADIEVKGLSELADILDQLPLELQKKAIRPALVAAAAPMEAEAKRLAPQVTGGLSRGIKTVVKVDPGIGGETYASIRSTSRISHLIEFGTALHKIATKTKKVMARLSASANGRGMKGKTTALGYQVYGKEVEHPGTRPQPFLRPAFDTKHAESLRTFADKLRESIVSTVRRAAKRK